MISCYRGHAHWLLVGERSVLKRKERLKTVTNYSVLVITCFHPMQDRINCTTVL